MIKRVKHLLLYPPQKIIIDDILVKNIFTDAPKAYLDNSYV